MPKEQASEFADSQVVEARDHSAPPAIAIPSGSGFFGHPRGLSTLFFTEMWERFSYYGMRAILILFMTAALVGENPGLGLTVGAAAAIYGLYTFFVYVLSLPGGWIADNLWGQKKAVFVGGVIIMMGHLSLAVPTNITFYLGLALVVIGTGLLKPNVSTMVGDLYPEGGARRDAGFSIFYMGINIGAFAGTFLVSWIGEDFNFHWGFSLAAVGMFIGLVQYKLGWKHLGAAGDLTTDDAPEVTARKSQRFYVIAAAFIATVVVLGFLIYTGILPISIQAVAGILGASVALLAVLYFASLMQDRRWMMIYVFVAILASVAAGTFIDRSSFVEPAREALTSNAVADQIAILRAEAEQAVAEGTLAEVPSTEQLAAAVPPGAVEAAVTEEAVQERARLDFLLRAFQIGIGLVVILFLLINVTHFMRHGREADEDHQRLFVIFWLFILAALFWMGFEQAGSSMNLFARDLTDRTIGDWEMPAGWLQNVNPFFIIVLAPVFGSMWVWLAKRNANPSIPIKFALGLFGLSVGFFVLAWGAANATPDNPVSPAWLVVTYFFHTAGELCLSPVGLSSMTKLAPRGLAGQMMGIWFIAAALGNLFAGLTAGQLETLAPNALFSNVAMTVGAAGIVALVASPFVKRLTGDIK